MSAKFSPAFSICVPCPSRSRGLALPLFTSRNRPRRAADRGQHLFRSDRRDPSRRRCAAATSVMSSDTPPTHRSSRPRCIDLVTTVGRPARFQTIRRYVPRTGPRPEKLRPEVLPRGLDLVPHMRRGVIKPRIDLCRTRRWEQTVVHAWVRPFVGRALGPSRLILECPEPPKPWH
jgi:hypothetical protein